MNKLIRVWKWVKLYFFHYVILWKKLFFPDKNEMNLEKFFKSLDGDSVNEGSVYLHTSNNPIIWIGMFKKIIINNLNFNKKVEEYFNSENFDIDEEDLTRASDFVIYHRAWFYISKLNLEKDSDVDAVRLSSDDDLKLTVGLSIQFFESIEDYEKCAFLKKIDNEILISPTKDLAP